RRHSVNSRLVSSLSRIALARSGNEAPGDTRRGVPEKITLENLVSGIRAAIPFRLAVSGWVESPFRLVASRNSRSGLRGSAKGPAQRRGVCVAESGSQGFHRFSLPQQPLHHLLESEPADLSHWRHESAFPEKSQEVARADPKHLRQLVQGDLRPGGGSF